MGRRDPPSLEATARRATGLPRHSEAKAGAATFRVAFWVVVIEPGLIVSDFRRGAVEYNTADYGFWVGGNTDCGTTTDFTDGTDEDGRGEREEGRGKRGEGRGERE